MNLTNNEYSAEEERFLGMIESNHKIGIQMCNEFAKNSSNPDIADLANRTIQLLYFQMQEIQRLMR